ncbi:MAG: hypothetical protein FWG22_02290 [Prolixibacteraceae bacterium]|nr:hypothetical protein [Prolixibacteraceae bacterium]
MDNQNKKPNLQELIEMFEKVSSLSGGCRGNGEDIMPEGHGEFGLEVTNPIPVHTIAGIPLYLNRLWTTDGIKITYERTGSTHAPNIPSIIDRYTIYGSGEEITKLYICPYNKKNSGKAPKGFVLK